LLNYTFHIHYSTSRFSTLKPWGNPSADT